MDNIPESIEEIEGRLALEPYNAELHQALGVALIRQGEFELALAALEYSSVLDPSDPFTYLYLGNWHFWQRDYSRALTQFRIAQRLEPDLGISLVCIADAYRNLDEPGLAGKYYHQAVQVDPHCEVAQENLRRWRGVEACPER